MDRNCVNYALEKLEEQEGDPRWTSPVKVQVQALQMELRMLKMFYWCFSTCPDAEEIVHDLAKTIFHVDFARLDLAVSVLLEKIELSKQKIRNTCVGFLDCSIPLIFKCFMCNPDEILQLFDLVLQNLIYVVNSKVNRMIFRVKKQIQSLQEQLRLFRNLADFIATRSDKHEELTDFFTHIQAWSNNVARLTILYWADHIDEKGPNFIEMHFRVQKGSKSSRFSDPIVIGELLGNFVDLFLENLAVSLTDHVEILHEGLIFLIAFLVDPPEKHAEDRQLILRPTAVVNEAVFLMCSLYALEIKEQNIKERDFLLFNFLEKIDTLKSEVRHFYVQIPQKLLSNSPMTNALGFIDSFLGKLKESLKRKGDMFIPFAKHQVVTVQAQLESLQPFLEDLTELQNEHKDIKDLRRRIINVAYQAEHVIDLCCFVKDRPIWYCIICLSEVIEEMKLLVLEVEKIKHKKTFNPANNASEKLEWSNMLPAPTNASRIHQVVGFKDATETIIQRLKRGSAQLDIVSIVGMPGQGKTTLANKVYYDSSIEYYFHKRAWCCVSQVYQRRSVLLDILSDIIAVNVETAMSDQELVEQLWRSLRGRRFLIVIDDIWDINVWLDLQRSFPDDNKGSRILLTSRIHSVPSQIKPGCNPLLLCPLSEEESWELMKLELQIKDDLPMDLLVLAMQIAKSCQGLPLAIIVIAGLLARKTDDMVSWWKQIAANLAQLAGEGCMGKLELSYMHLPDYLKPCFLYFGIFPEDTQIKVQNLIQLWIAEGFIQGTKTKSLKDVANEYLRDLVDRNLVRVTKRRRWDGRMKECSVHDLIRDLCLLKAKEEYFFQQAHGYDGYDVSRSSLNPIKYDQYRLSVYTAWEPFIESRPTGPRIRSLLFFHGHSFNSYYGDIFCNFKHLRVLKMDSISLGSSFPKEIEVLALLKYLEIKGSFSWIPSSIVNLQNLETFIFTSIECYCLVLPATIWKIKSLKHVDIHWRVVFSFDDPEVESFQSSNIESLSSVIISGEVCAKELLRRLQELRKLTCFFQISNDNFQKPYRWFTMFNTLSKLESLKLVGLSKRLQRKQFTEFILPITLKKLTFSQLALPENGLSVIGQLPNLEVLKLREVYKFRGVWKVRDEQFVKLKFLQLHDIDIRKWDVSNTEEPFPCLEWLLLTYCRKLEEIPSCFGYISTLKCIQVGLYCGAARNSASQILNEQREMGNEDLEVYI